jgi:hypothetical protein
MNSFEYQLVKQFPDDFEKYQKTECELKARDDAAYLRLQDRPCVKKLIDIGGFCGEVGIIMLHIERIDELLATGWGYNNIPYACGMTCELAFLLHLEETMDTQITNVKQFQKLAKIDLQTTNIKPFYYAALEGHYSLVLSKMLRNGSTYDAILSVNPRQFGLPGKWKDSLGNDRSKEEIIQFVIVLYLNECLLSSSEQLTLQAIADRLKAPYKVIQAADQCLY